MAKNDCVSFFRNGGQFKYFSINDTERQKPRGKYVAYKSDKLAPISWDEIGENLSIESIELLDPEIAEIGESEY